MAVEWQRRPALRVNDGRQCTVGAVSDHHRSRRGAEAAVTVPPALLCCAWPGLLCSAALHRLIVTDPECQHRRALRCRADRRQTKAAEQRPTASFDSEPNVPSVTTSLTLL